MRIISGTHRGIVIPSPKEQIVRPTLDRVKENIFNILQFKIDGSRCLDLFCGSGALGLECLSRGAKSIDFVDNNKNNVSALQKFLNRLNEKNYEIHNCDYYEALRKFKDEGKQFDIILLDPPFDSDLAQIAIQKIYKFDLLSENGTIMWEHDLEEKNSYKQKVKDSRTYGKIMVEFLVK